MTNCIISKNRQRKQFVELSRKISCSKATRNKKAKKFEETLHLVKPKPLQRRFTSLNRRRGVRLRRCLNSYHRLSRQLLFQNYRLLKEI